MALDVGGAAPPRARTRRRAPRRSPMTIWLTALWMVAAGGLIALQAPLNATLGRAVGAMPGAALSFAIGTCALVLVALLFGGGFGRLGAVRELSPIYLGGGVVGAAFVVTALVAVGRLGATGVVAANVVGQFAMAVVIDVFGLFGVAATAISPLRIAGLALLVAGTALVVASTG